MFVVHEFFYAGYEVAVKALHVIGRLLHPDRGRLLILDKETDVLDAGNSPRYFTEFKLAHDLTKQRLVNSKYWSQVLSDAGLETTAEQRLAPHTGTVQFVCRRGQ
jgi:hypothetical protein